MSGPNLFNPFDGLFGYPGIVPPITPTGGNGGGIAYYVHCPGTDVALITTNPVNSAAGPFATFELAQAWFAQHPDFGGACIAPTVPSGNGGECQPVNKCYERPDGYIIQLGPTEQPDPSWKPVPCPQIIPPQITKTECCPSGDYSRVIQDFGDGTKANQLSKELINQSINDYIDGKTPLDWWKEQYEKFKDSTIDIQPISIGVE